MDGTERTRRRRGLGPESLASNGAACNLVVNRRPVSRPMSVAGRARLKDPQGHHRPFPQPSADWVAVQPDRRL